MVHKPYRRLSPYDLTSLPERERLTSVGSDIGCVKIAPQNSLLQPTTYFRLTPFHLVDAEEEAQSLFLQLVKEYNERENVSEQLKAENPMKWVLRIYFIRKLVAEVVNNKDSMHNRFMTIEKTLVTAILEILVGHFCIVKKSYHFVVVDCFIFF